MTDAERAQTASELRSAMNNNALTIGNTAYGIDGQPVVFNGNTQGWFLPYVTQSLLDSYVSSSESFYLVQEYRH